METEAAFQFNITSAVSPIANDEQKSAFLKQVAALAQADEQKLKGSNTFTLLTDSPSWLPELMSQMFVPSEQKYINIKMHSNWYMFYAEYYFETWITSTADPNGSRVTVPSLELKWRYGDVKGIERGANVDMVSKSERLYATRAFTPGEMCAHGLCTDDQGGTGFVSTPTACIWA